MLDAHPAMAVPPESHFVVTLGRRSRRYRAGDRFAIDRFVDDLVGRWGFGRWELDPSAVRARLSEARVDSFPDAIREVFAMYAERQGKTRYAEKTPINILHVPYLARTFPEARFIHLIRDGRDVALSYLDADFGVESLSEAAIYWRRFVRTGRHDGGRLGDRYREIRYEDLLDDPEGSLRELCSFIELPYDPAMLSYHHGAERLLATTSRSEHHQRLRLPPTAGLRDWRRQMDPQDVLLFEALAGDLLGQLGYERAYASIPPTVSARAAAHRLGVMTQRIRRRFSKGVRGHKATPRRDRSSTAPAPPSTSTSLRRSP